MWLALLYEPTEAGPDDLVVSTWDADGRLPFTIGGAVEDAPRIARALRNASGGRLAAPRCDCCRTPLELPPL